MTEDTYGRVSEYLNGIDFLLGMGFGALGALLVVAVVYAIRARGKEGQ